MRAARYPGPALAAALLAMLVCCRTAGAGAAAPRPDVGQIGAGTLLIAARQLHDVNFGESVVLIFEHGNQGTIGAIINRRTRLSVSQVLPEIPELEDRRDHLYLGGPVRPNTIRILVRSERPLEDGHPLFADVYYLEQVTSLRELAARTDPPLQMRFYAGYAGWSPDQLAAEILRGDWHIAPADAASVFADDVETLWPTLIKRFSGLWTVR